MHFWTSCDRTSQMMVAKAQDGPMPGHCNTGSGKHRFSWAESQSVCTLRRWGIRTELPTDSQSLISSRSSHSNYTKDCRRFVLATVICSTWYCQTGNWDSSFFYTCALKIVLRKTDRIYFPCPRKTVTTQWSESAGTPLSQEARLETQPAPRALLLWDLWFPLKQIPMWILDIQLSTSARLAPSGQRYLTTATGEQTDCGTWRDGFCQWQQFLGGSIVPRNSIILPSST